MDEAKRSKILELIEKLAEGNATVESSLVDALKGVDVDFLVELAGHDSRLVRCVVVDAAKGRAEPALVTALAAFAKDAAEEVRTRFAEQLSSEEQWTVDEEVVTHLLADECDAVRQAGARAAGVRGLALAGLFELLHGDEDWSVRDAAARALAPVDASKALPELIQAIASDDDSDVVRSCALMAEGHLEKNLGLEFSGIGSAEELMRARERLQRARMGGAKRLLALLDQHTSEAVDLTRLAKFGTDLTAEARAGRLPRAYGVEETIDVLERVVTGEDARSAVLVGASGVGKTALVHELAHRLANDPTGPWCVLRVSAADLLTGTQYMGEWQTRVDELIQASSRPRRVLLFVPALEELADAGRASNSDMSVASMLAPHIERGRIVLLGETTPAAWSRGLGRDASSRNLFARIEVAPSSGTATREALAYAAAEAEVELSAELTERLMDFADLYLTGTELPGRAIGLLRRLLQSGERREFTERDVLYALNQSTGIPVDFLDDAVPLRLDTVREFFETRVMGQPDAIERVLDLVTLVKAGLTAPDKPSGVLLFVGPTGVGKTELARSLAELLFGDAARLLRYDMSEFATYESFERLIGARGQVGLLTEAVREHPFSVLLFDEIEKSHANVFDLCLQIFDAGRLTDGRGQTVNFANTIVVLTSNVGSKLQTEPNVGFGGEVQAGIDRATIDRELRRFFRPEFLGRIDDIVHFRPLSAETADRIARREVTQVLRRGGIARRRLTVEVEPEVYALLLRRGYSLALGARPLKRTVESLVLLPIARAIATASLPVGAHLRLEARGDAVRLEVATPEDEDGEVRERAAADVEALRERIHAMHAPAQVLEERRSALVERSNAAAFWDDRAAALEVLDELHRLDRLLDELRRLEQELETTATNPNKRRAARFLEQHTGEVARLARLLECDDLADAFIILTRVQSERGGLGGVERLARMYRGYAARARLECEVVEDRVDGESDVDSVILALRGAGAYALLAEESGLHQLALRERSAGRARSSRELVRVEVLRSGAGDVAFEPNEVRIQARELRRPVPGRLGAAARSEVQVFHVPTMTSVSAWSPRERDEATRELLALLRARLEVRADSQLARETVRRYVFGASPLVRDRRTGRTTGKLDRVLAGELELVREE